MRLPRRMAVRPGAVLIFLLITWCQRVDAQDVVLQMTEHDPASQEFPCPDQNVVYECRVLLPSAGLQWILNDSTLFPGFTAASSINTIRRTSDDKFIATLTGKLEDSDPDSDDFLFTSTLLIKPPLTSLNGSILECRGQSITVNSTTITVSGFPDPPLNLAHDISANTETSTVIQWQAPLYTGGDGISSMEYTVTVGNQTWSVPVSDDDSDMFIHTITGLHYNTDYSVSVTAINSCGMESKPASVTVNIEARVPPMPTILPTELYCDVSLKEYRPVVIKWMYGAEEEGVVYPGAVVVSVELDPGDIACSITEDTSCTALITRDDVYTVSLTLRNDVGSTQAAMNSFNSQLLQVENNLSSASPSVTVTLNEMCLSSTVYTVSVLFGVTEESNDCEVKQNITASFVPGRGKTFTNTLILGPGQEYCFIITLADDASLPPDTSTEDSGSDGLSAGAAAGITVAISLLVSLPVGVVIGCCGMWCMMRRGRGSTSGGTQQKMEQLQGAIYEEPGPVDTAIPLSDNQAYGHVNMQRRN